MIIDLPPSQMDILKQTVLIPAKTTTRTKKMMMMKNPRPQTATSESTTQATTTSTKKTTPLERVMRIPKPPPMDDNRLVAPPLQSRKSKARMRRKLRCIGNREA